MGQVPSSYETKMELWRYWKWKPWQQISNFELPKSIMMMDGARLHHTTKFQRLDKTHMPSIQTLFGHPTVPHHCPYPLLNPITIIAFICAIISSIKPFLSSIFVSPTLLTKRMNMTWNSFFLLQLVKFSCLLLIIIQINILGSVYRNYFDQCYIQSQKKGRNSF